MAISNGHNDYSVTDELAAHYNGVREQRGWSWETLAAYFEQQDTDPTSRNLAEWAQAQAEAPKSKRAKTPPTEKR